ncbi:hypothetical protein AVEN_247087-1 [Araneus ventricosus]|uniref:Uncharacterized protein n=1 Tax=Araneus ventricosus TaxID=182803 RepID=A0A4Y2SZC0_ARAVE|nr:hypothetical protein AVEN_247087-1 [Araneus ventricosus]
MDIESARCTECQKNIFITIRINNKSRLIRVPGSKPDSTGDTLCIWTRYTLNQTSWAKSPNVGVVRKLGVAVPAQVSSLPYDRNLKLRSLSQNSPRVASKRDFNITKLNLILNPSYFI